MAIIGMGRPDVVAEVSMMAPQRGICRVCAGPIREGQEVLLDRATLTFRHLGCVDRRSPRREVPGRSFGDRSADV
jgi:hypothetical protein